MIYKKAVVILRRCAALAKYERGSPYYHVAQGYMARAYELFAYQDKDSELAARIRAWIFHGLDDYGRRMLRYDSCDGIEITFNI